MAEFLASFSGQGGALHGNSRNGEWRSFSRLASQLSARDNGDEATGQGRASTRSPTPTKPSRFGKSLSLTYYKGSTMNHLAIITVASFAFVVSAGIDCPAIPTVVDRTAYVALLKEYPDRPGDYINEGRARGKVAATKFFAFTRDHPETPEAVECLGWVASHCLYSDESIEALRWIARDYADRPNLAPILSELDRMYGGPFEAKESMLRAVRKGSPHPTVRGRAALSLARELSMKRARAQRDALQHDLFMKGALIPFVAKPKATEADHALWSKEAVALCESIADDPAYDDTLRTEAKSALREISEPATKARGNDKPTS
jgi:hypothetical protein